MVANERRLKRVGPELVVPVFRKDRLEPAAGALPRVAAEEARAGRRREEVPGENRGHAAHKG